MNLLPPDQTVSDWNWAVVPAGSCFDRVDAEITTDGWHSRMCVKFTGLSAVVADVLAPKYFATLSEVATITTPFTPGTPCEIGIEVYFQNQRLNHGDGGLKYVVPLPAYFFRLLRQLCGREMLDARTDTLAIVHQGVRTRVHVGSLSRRSWLLDLPIQKSVEESQDSENNEWNPPPVFQSTVKTSVKNIQDQADQHLEYQSERVRRCFSVYYTGKPQESASTGVTLFDKVSPLWHDVCFFVSMSAGMMKYEKPNKIDVGTDIRDCQHGEATNDLRDCLHCNPRRDAEQDQGRKTRHNKFGTACQIIEDVCSKVLGILGSGYKVNIIMLRGSGIPFSQKGVECSLLADGKDHRPKLRNYLQAFGVNPAIGDPPEIAASPELTSPAGASYHLAFTGCLKGWSESDFQEDAEIATASPKDSVEKEMQGMFASEFKRATLFIAKKLGLQKYILKQHIKEPKKRIMIVFRDQDSLSKQELQKTIQEYVKNGTIDEDPPIFIEDWHNTSKAELHQIVVNQLKLASRNAEIDFSDNSLEMDGHFSKFFLVQQQIEEEKLWVSHFIMKPSYSNSQAGGNIIITKTLPKELQRGPEAYKLLGFPDGKEPTPAQWKEIQKARTECTDTDGDNGAVFRDKALYKVIHVEDLNGTAQTDSTPLPDEQAQDCHKRITQRALEREAWKNYDLISGSQWQDWILTMKGEELPSISPQDHKFDEPTLLKIREVQLTELLSDASEWIEIPHSNMYPCSKEKKKFFDLLHGAYRNYRQQVEVSHCSEEYRQHLYLQQMFIDLLDVNTERLKSLNPATSVKGQRAFDDLWTILNTFDEPRRVCRAGLSKIARKIQAALPTETNNVDQILLELEDLDKLATPPESYCHTRYVFTNPVTTNHVRVAVGEEQNAYFWYRLEGVAHEQLFSEGGILENWTGLSDNPYKRFFHRLKLTLSLLLHRLSSTDPFSFFDKEQRTILEKIIEFKETADDADDRQQNPFYEADDSDSVKLLKIYQSLGLLPDGLDWTLPEQAHLPGLSSEKLQEQIGLVSLVATRMHISNIRQTTGTDGRIDPEELPTHKTRFGSAAFEKFWEKAYSMDEILAAREALLLYLSWSFAAAGVRNKSDDYKDFTAAVLSHYVTYYCPDFLPPLYTLIPMNRAQPTKDLRAPNSELPDYRQILIQTARFTDPEAPNYHPVGNPPKGWYFTFPEVPSHHDMSDYLGSKSLSKGMHTGNDKFWSDICEMQDPDSDLGPDALMNYRDVLAKVYGRFDLFLHVEVNHKCDYCSEPDPGDPLIIAPLREQLWDVCVGKDVLNRDHPLAQKLARLIKHTFPEAKPEHDRQEGEPLLATLWRLRSKNSKSKTVEQMLLEYIIEFPTTFVLYQCLSHRQQPLLNVLRPN